MLSALGQKVNLVELSAPKFSPKWNQQSTFLATGRPSENRAPAAARTLLSTLGQTPTSMKKALLILSACPSRPFSVPEACKHQKRRLQSQKWTPKLSQSDSRYHQKSLLWDSQGHLEDQGGIAMVQKTSMAPKSHQISSSITRGQCKAYHSSHWIQLLNLTCNPSAFSLQSCGPITIPCGQITRSSGQVTIFYNHTTILYGRVTLLYGHVTLLHGHVTIS